MLSHLILTPHPPAIIPAVGGPSTRLFAGTINALLTVGLTLRDDPPDTIIILSPHGEVSPDSFAVRVPRDPLFHADFAEFGAPNVTATYPRDRITTAKIIESAASRGLRTTPIDDAMLDFGVAVPMHYLAASCPAVSLVCLGMSLISAERHFALGQAIREIADESDERIAFVASVELSHRHAGSPHGVHPMAKKWDADIIRDLEKGDVAAIIHRDVYDVDDVAGAEYRGLATLLGVAGERKIEVLHYEAPGGVGCAVGRSV